jgi:LytS/YehU family sensor histidine kinase
MPLDAANAPPRGLAVALGWRRFVLALAVSALWGLVLSNGFATVPATEVMFRLMLVGIVAMLAFGLFEQWPRRLPRWLARWALQVVAVAVSIPLAVLAIYLLLSWSDQQPFWENATRKIGFMTITMTSLLIAPWIAVAALFRKSEFAARSQALAFELERSELERNALDARLKLLQAQVEPHFLFNTLANVQELVDVGSPQASKVLASLVAYLRAAVPRMHEATTTLGQELELVRAYLELMHMRMPDRLQFTLQADEAARSLVCPPMTLLTLVENAVRHGIDPSEEGGRIDVRVRVADGRCHAEVCDTGVGLTPTAGGLGTGLSTLRERLQLVFGGDAQLRLSAMEPQGICAEVEFPARSGAAA